MSFFKRTTCKYLIIISIVCCWYEIDIVTQYRTSSPEAEGQSLVTRVCSPRRIAAANCSFLRSLSLLIVRGTVLIGARIFTASRCPIVCWLEMRFKVNFDSRACVHSRELDTVTRLTQRRPSWVSRVRPLRDCHMDSNRNIVFFSWYIRKKARISQFRGINGRGILILANQRLNSRDSTKMEVRD